MRISDWSSDVCSSDLILDMVAEFRQTDAQTPVVLMGYLNPVEARGIKAFSERAQQVGVDGVLLVDLAIEEAQDYVPVLGAHGLDCIFLLASTSSASRVAAVAVAGRGRWEAHTPELWSLMRHSYDVS